MHRTIAALLSSSLLISSVFGYCDHIPAMKKFDISEMVGEWYMSEAGSSNPFFVDPQCFKMTIAAGSNGKVSQTNYYYDNDLGDYTTDSLEFKEVGAVFFYGPDLGELTLMHTDYDKFALFYQCNRDFPATFWKYQRSGVSAEDLEKSKTYLDKKMKKLEYFDWSWVANLKTSEADGCVYA